MKYLMFKMVTATLQSKCAVSSQLQIFEGICTRYK